MRVFKVSKGLSQKIADEAASRAWEATSRRKWTTGHKIVPVGELGAASLRVPRHYLYQEYGTRPFDMTSLEGKVVPLPQGPRRVRGVGQPGWVTLPGGVRVFRERKWHHPGIKPTYLLRSSLRDAILEFWPEIQGEAAKFLLSKDGEVV